MLNRGSLPPPGRRHMQAAAAEINAPRSAFTLRRAHFSLLLRTKYRQRALLMKRRVL